MREERQFWYRRDGRRRLKGNSAISYFPSCLLLPCIRKNTPHSSLCGYSVKECLKRFLIQVELEKSRPMGQPCTRGQRPLLAWALPVTSTHTFWPGSGVCLGQHACLCTKGTGTWYILTFWEQTVCYEQNKSEVITFLYCAPQPYKMEARPYVYLHTCRCRVSLWISLGSFRAICKVQILG